MGSELDWNASQKDQAYVRYSTAPDHHARTSPWVHSRRDGFGGNVTNLAENLMLSETHVFTPTLANEFVSATTGCIQIS